MSEPTTPLTREEYAAREQRASAAEQEHFHAVQELRERLMTALGGGELSVTFTLPTLRWLGILDEIQDRRPRNYSQLLRDDTIDRLNAAIDRVHDEANFMVSYGPSGSIAARVDPDRQPSRRDLASPELRRVMRDKGEKN